MPLSDQPSFDLKALTDSLFTVIRESGSPNLWSKAVELTRRASCTVEVVSDEELSVRVADGRAVTPRVTLWPRDDNWSCDCDSEVDPCVHAAAAVIAIRSGTATVESGAGSVDAAVRTAETVVHYAFERQDGWLHFARYLVSGDRREPFTGSLVAHVGGIQSGRIRGQAVSATKADFTVDSIAQSLVKGRMDRDHTALLLRALLRMPNVTLDGEPVQTSTELVKLRAQVVREREGFRLTRIFEPPVSELFKNGIARTGAQLRQVDVPPLTHSERDLLSTEGCYFPPWESDRLFGDIVPSLGAKMPVDIPGADMPSVERIPPRIVIETSTTPDGRMLLARPRLFYGDPPLAEVMPRGLELFGSRVPARDQSAEDRLRRDVQQELHLQVGSEVRLAVEDALRLIGRLGDWTVTGEGVAAFRIVEALVPSVEVDDDRLELYLQVPGSGPPNRLPFATVASSWERGEKYVQLPQGGWAQVPREWLAQYGAAAQQLLAARDADGGIAPAVLPRVGELCEMLEVESPLAVRSLRERLSTVPADDMALPEDLPVSLRSYQRTGVAWLRYLSQLGFGAMLADDMGLGKTLQALCALQGRTLVVAPTSVIYGWAEQSARFRPSLRVCLYHGPSRYMDDEADLVITSYGVLRVERELLTGIEWGTVIVDEAQQIKNPESLGARAAHELRGKQRMVLTGTPIENSLEDLWSQFQVINPGLLGSRAAFQERFARMDEAGAARSQERLRALVRPFILRRLKRDVAPELPPRTEVTLSCELGEQEREVYRTVLTATRREILEKLEAGAGVFSILESLLRLRQVCCLPSLVPGVDLTESTKLSLLVESLNEGWALGHRALVFSQWTSLLDAVEPRLHAAGLNFSRLDGQTRNRQEVVEKFQQEGGPPVMLLSLKAGGTGLTLTAADHVYLLDPWWNPAVEDQAADRAHRIGQENPVLIRKLIARDTIEERIQELQQKKLALARAITEGESAGDISVTREDLLALLQ